MKYSFVMITGLLGAISLSDAQAGNNVSFGYSQSVVSTGGYSAPVYSAPAPVAYNNPTQRYCREYNGQALVAGRYQQTYGTACMQPDGSWQVQTPNGIGTTLDYIPPPVAYSQPVTYYNPPAYYAPPAPVYYGAPSYPYSRSSFSVFVNDSNLDRHRRGSYYNHRQRDDGWSRRVWRDDWNRGGHGGGHGRGHGGGHGGGHWR